MDHSIQLVLNFEKYYIFYKTDILCKVDSNDDTLKLSFNSQSMDWSSHHFNFDAYRKLSWWWSLILPSLTTWSKNPLGWQGYSQQNTTISLLLSECCLIKHMRGHQECSVKLNIQADKLAMQAHLLQHDPSNRVPLISTQFHLSSLSGLICSHCWETIIWYQWSTKQTKNYLQKEHWWIDTTFEKLLTDCFWTNYCIHTHITCFIWSNSLIHLACLPYVVSIQTD